MKVSDQIRMRIESAIASGELLPGDAIDDVALAHHYKVSRSLASTSGAGYFDKHPTGWIDGGQNEFATAAFLVGTAGGA